MDIPLFAAKLALTNPKTLENIVRDCDVHSANALDKSKLPHKPAPRVVFRNGGWFHFCTRYFYHAAGPFNTEKAAMAALAR